MESVSIPTIIGEKLQTKKKKKSDSTAAYPTSKIVSSYIEM